MENPLKTVVGGSPILNTHRNEWIWIKEALSEAFERKNSCSCRYYINEATRLKNCPELLAASAESRIGWNSLADPVENLHPQTPPPDVQERVERPTREDCARSLLQDDGLLWFMVYYPNLSQTCWCKRFLFWACQGHGFETLGQRRAQDALA